jgi:hypothetical protein
MAKIYTAFDTNKGNPIGKEINMNQTQQLKKLKSKELQARAILNIWCRHKDDKNLPKVKAKDVLRRIRNILEG